MHFMANPEYITKLVEYFQKNLKKGYTPESLRWALINQGYSKAVIEKSLEQANKELAQEAPILKEKPRIKYEIIDENDNPIMIRKPWWKRIFEL